MHKNMHRRPLIPGHHDLGRGWGWQVLNPFLLLIITSQDYGDSLP